MLKWHKAFSFLVELTPGRFKLFFAPVVLKITTQPAARNIPVSIMKKIKKHSLQFAINLKLQICYPLMESPREVFYT